MRRWSAWLVALALFPATSLAARGVADEDSRTDQVHAGSGQASDQIASSTARMLEIDREVRAEMARQKIPGVAVGVVDHGVVTTRGYGFANVEHNVPVTADTIFQSGSVGKMFTATAVMLLVEDGKIALADPLTK